MLQAITARFRAIQQLQQIHSEHQPGSARYEQVEYALDLALSERRSVDDYLVRNLLRDAKRILDRQKASRRYVTIESVTEAEQSIPEQFIDTNTPEAILAAKQFVEVLLGLTASASRHTERVMEGLLLGESLDETATAAGISPARVNQLRHSLRQAALDHVRGRRGH